MSSRHLRLCHMPSSSERLPTPLYAYMMHAPQVHFHHHDREGYKIVTKDPSYLLDLTSYRWV